MTWPLEYFAVWRMAELHREAAHDRLAALVERQPNAIAKLLKVVASRVSARLPHEEAAAATGKRVVPPTRHYPYGFAHDRP